MSLKQYSDPELAEELERRKRTSEIPDPLMNYDISRLRNLILFGVAEVRREGTEPKDFRHQIYETALETFYGPLLWVPYNKALHR